MDQPAQYGATAVSALPEPEAEGTVGADKAGVMESLLYTERDEPCISLACTSAFSTMVSICE